MRALTLIFSSFLTALVSLAVPAQATDPAGVTVTVQIGYRERIALPPGSVATITLSDVSLRDVAAPVIAQIEFPIRGVPAPFELVTPRDSMTSGRTYALRATIHDNTGKLRWTTDSVHPVDPEQAQSDLGLLLLKQVGTADQSTVDLDLIEGEWLIEDIDGRGVIDFLQTTLAFTPDGKVSGTGGCNRYSGTYELSGDILSIGPLAVTQMACPEAISNQERAFFEVIASPLRVAFDATGAMVLSDDAEQSLTARRM